MAFKALSPAQVSSQTDTAQAVQTDPDAEAQEAERAGEKAPAASLMCAGPPSKGSPLDF